MRNYPWDELFCRLFVFGVGVFCLGAACYVAGPGTESALDPAAALIFGLVGLSSIAQACSL